MTDLSSQVGKGLATEALLENSCLSRKQIKVLLSGVVPWEGWGLQPPLEHASHLRKAKNDFFPRFWHL